LSYQGSSGVEIATELKSLKHALAIGHMRQDSELKLAVISDDKSVTWLGHEGFPDAVDILVACWLVLQVGSSAGNAASLRIQIHTAVDSARFVRLFLQRGDVGREQLLNAFETDIAVKSQAHFLAKLFLSLLFKVIVGSPELAFAGVIACQLF
jgi:hypothetical protein